ncbi:MAG: hypothetical protein ACXU9D_02465, partial [Xanthobacteraceae bacterium]
SWPAAINRAAEMDSAYFIDNPPSRFPWLPAGFVVVASQTAPQGNDIATIAMAGRRQSAGPDVSVGLGFCHSFGE